MWLSKVWEKKSASSSTWFIGENSGDGVWYPEKGGTILPNPQGSEGGEVVGIQRAQAIYHWLAPEQKSWGPGILLVMSSKGNQNIIKNGLSCALNRQTIRPMNLTTNLWVLLDPSITTFQCAQVKWCIASRLFAQCGVCDVQSCS